MPTHIHASQDVRLHTSFPSLLSISCSAFITFCSHPLPVFFSAPSYHCECLWEAESSATGRYVLTPPALSLIQRDQRLSSRGPFITMTPSVSSSLSGCQAERGGYDACHCRAVSTFHSCWQPSLVILFQHVCRNESTMTAQINIFFFIANPVLCKL